MQQQDEPQLQQQQQRPLECGVCLLVYEEQDRRPRSLPCGHTFCSLCVAVLLQDGRLTCRSCHTNHLAPGADHFPINYALEAMVRELQAAVAGTPVAAEEASLLPIPRDSQARGVKRKQKASAGLSRKMQSMIQEQQTSLGSLAATLQQELDQLNQYRAQLALSREEHGRLLEELDRLVQQHRAAMELLQKEDVRVKAFVEKGQEVQREVKAAQGQLQQVSTSQQAFSTIDATDHTAVEAEKWLQHSKEKMPNTTALSTSYKVVEGTKAALEAARTVAEAMTHQHTSGHLHCTVMEAVEMLKGGPVKLVDVCSERLRKALEGDQVFAVQKLEDGTQYSSRITRVGTETLLHSLQPGSPPLGSWTLKVSEAVEDLDYRSILVFLDVSWPGMRTDRVRIQLEADTPLTRQFVALCLGHTGLTYCNTTFLRMEYDKNYWIVWLGDISGQIAANDYKLPPLQANNCGNTVIPRKGMLVAKTDLSNIAQSTQFGIVIAGAEGWFNSKQFYHLGRVQNAEVSFVETAVNSIIPKNNIQVVECAIVLSR